ncbi:MAG: hypothetical protein A2725_02105 [Candidatus Magasanikbacteria bacterium RIFCSPHIGHO2_01_FULL_33_34]|uniref:Membrane insertase YidC/Oxa/ALB C-terminal domain-containing protein n=1 Tax=Candidatus Magasanikbacteria bacterium RIFCSPHIGHO2_01_FULL_33_34 TaxID=1798671 RepID=A0A1F6LK77_9BACT|nr:MAG: hypothetical protein A2725_02105 [Candidatus Magasanikbacteria bacterium RIFCSPHIGHO2_01_FULL_33_34]OGH65561.1 MAG: hypothetical protein A3B83_01680 [Candidatus Magasanikbacteria bacterium RIFCSPHIGHO2_02_FULL_33_17]OGH76271.1 MAG: hypothetical protein A3A89_02500 [Candidatus Magasanikbacteria bacterium RIFCSPLOWO2_01_FULL_33_34]
MRELFQTILYEPIFNLFVGLYNIIPDVGIVILIITLAIRIVLYPMTKKSIAAQKSMTDLQPKLEELKIKYKGDQQTLAQETMKLYKENKVNPLGSCLPILVQLPVFIAIYWVLQEGLGSEQNFDTLYSFVKNPGEIKTISLGFIDLGQKNIILAAAAGLAQYWQSKMMQSKKPPKEAGEGAKDESTMSMVNKQMLYFMPGLTFFIGMSFPGGLALYWFLSTLLTALQQKYMLSDKEKNTETKEEKKIVEKTIEGEVEEIKDKPTETEKKAEETKENNNT